MTQIPLSTAYEHAQAIAASSESLMALKAVGDVVYAEIQVKHASEWLDLDRAHDVLRLHILAGRYEEADCLARDIKRELVADLAARISDGRIDVGAKDDDDEEPEPVEVRPDPDAPALYGARL